MTARSRSPDGVCQKHLLVSSHGPAAGCGTTIRAMDPLHRMTLDAFCKIEPSGLLATAMLDQKAEKFVTVALASILNTKDRFAVTEYKHVDLIVAEEPWTPSKPLPRWHAEYQAKCAYLNDYRDEHSNLHRSDHCPHDDKGHPVLKNAEYWLGRCLRHDLECAPWASKRTAARARGGIFFLFDIEPCSAQAKYASKPSQPLGIAGAKAVVDRLVGWPAVEWVESKSGRRHGATLKIHMGLFDLPVRRR